jgi:hypothetical protein
MIVGGARSPAFFQILRLLVDDPHTETQQSCDIANRNFHARELSGTIRKK